MNIAGAGWLQSLLVSPESAASGMLLGTLGSKSAIVRQMKSSVLIEHLKLVLGPDTVLTDDASIELASMDIYSAGPRPLAVVRPTSADQLVLAVASIGEADCVMVPRGGGVSYTGGIVPPEAGSVVIDTSALDRILRVDDVDMYVTVEAGCTWQTLFEELSPRGLRVPFWGPLSGSKATVGGSVSQQAVLWGSGRYGPSSESVLGLRVVVASGEVITTGTGAIEGAIPNYRHFGPDLTGLFLADSGAFGIKSEVTLRVMRVPAAQGFASFAFADRHGLLEAMAELARAELVVAGFGLDPVLTEQRVRRGSLSQGIDAVRSMVGKSSNKLGAIRDAVRMAAKGRGFLESGTYTLHVMAEARSQAGLAVDLERIDKICAEATKVDNTVPKLLAAKPYASLTSALGPEGQRWAPLHVLVPFSRASAAWDQIEELQTRHTPAMETHHVEMGYMTGTISNSMMLIELVMTWPGPLTAYYRHAIDAAKLKRYPDYAPDPDADELVALIRNELVDLFAELGGSHLQIGRRYRYFDRLNPETQDLLMSLKRQVDPKNLMNPGVLGLVQP